MIKHVFQAQSYMGLGIINTRHGYEILEHVLKQGNNIKCGIVVTDDAARLELCRQFWEEKNWLENDELQLLLKQSHNVLHTDTFYVDKLYISYSIPFIYVPDFGDIAASLAQNSKAEAALLLEAPIIRGSILGALPAGIVNFHAAPLPEYRGNFATYWTFYHNEPLVLTAHLVQYGVDNGPIIMQKGIPVYSGETLKDIDNRAIKVAAQVALEIMNNSPYGMRLRPQQAWEGRLFKGAMPEDIVRECERRLQAGEYGFYVDA